MLPAITIITPTFNRGKFLKRMLKSVLEQSFQNWELIILDDGSNDNTQEVVKSFDDPRITYFYFIKHSGAGDKRNEGIRRAKSKYITFLDSDDEALPDWLEKINKKILEKYSLISCGYERIQVNKTKNIVLPQYMGDFDIRINFKSGTLCIDKKVLQGIGGFDPSLASGLNTDLILRVLPYILTNKLSYIYINEALVRVHEHSKNRIRNNNQAVLFGTLVLLDKHNLWFKRNPQEYKDYLGVAGAGLAKEGNFKKSRNFFIKAFKIKPGFKPGLKIILTSIPFLGKKIWKNE
ncbi:glycosyltransferase family 2 protein [Salegentibacter sediminis]|uniref:glycosyltransferase family 2 protein n=1 Tax=Salegentibacter sediminis TaxID=1930251 RepID=UPI0009C0D1CA|nr:glycosyltransferase family 2 protein [Salegentibacter sediminis]